MAEVGDGLPAFPAQWAADLLESAEKLLEPGGALPGEALAWRSYLDRTGCSPFLQALPSREHRYRWAETTFKAIRRSGYSLADMLARRLQLHPGRILFREPGPDVRSAWTYAEVAQRLKVMAGLFCRSEAEPRVAIFCENSVDSACCDLACLVHRIFDAPLNIHYDAPCLAWIFDRLAINIAIVDTEERFLRLEEVRKRCARWFRIFYSQPAAAAASAAGGGAEALEEACARLDLAGLEALLARRHSRPITDAATAMFTSGSTGAPKGIVFTHYHLVAKRFARAAALPDVGDNEVLLCYLPLFHTFGRYLEMLGTIYWGGTYVFAGNPSVETLISQLKEIQPTGLISVPLRWSQIRTYCLENTREGAAQAVQERVLRSIIGERLRWGLSAAGHLDPKVFRFFQRHGVELCSGFGMTEATGGITMTPAGEYVDGTVGIPLPGIRVRLGANGELEIAGEYVARYLEETGRADLAGQNPDEEYWFATGDLFREHRDRYLEIVDRIKDIYKNNRGQTVAPRRVEQKFDGVPGIRRVFLAGDGRDANVLLIVPDRTDNLVNAADAEVHEYLHQIVAAANADLAPYERIVNFALLDRDLDVERDELTAKGSYRRRIIEEHFVGLIESLYQGNYLDLPCASLHAHIPRWFFRDLGVLENDIVAEEGGLYCRGTGRRLPLAKRAEDNRVLVGDLEYHLAGGIVDFGLFARQPKIWAGNPALASFAPCKDGWDLPMPTVSVHVRLPDRAGARAQSPVFDEIPRMRDARLRLVHRLCMEALFRPKEVALEAVTSLSDELKTAGDRMSALIRSRLEALSRHPEEEVRCLAYRVLLTDEPTPDYSRVFPAFVDSGLTFLNEKSVRALADTGLGDKRLQALRRRLFDYRTQLSWPASATVRGQFEKIFDLLANIARKDASFYGPVRAELASWALHRADLDLAQAAERQLSALREWFDTTLAAAAPAGGAAGKVVLAEGIAPSDARRIEQIFSDPTFLKESILLAFDEKDFDLDEVQPSGIWVSRIMGQRQFDLYRAGVNLRNGKHFDLLLVTGDDSARVRVCDTLYWLTSLAEHPSQARVLPRLGACRPELGVMSVAYVSDLTAWEKIRSYAGALSVRSAIPSRHEWRCLFVRGMAAFFSAWNISGGRIIPGAATPENVVVPDADFREGAYILSLTAWRPYAGPLSLVLPLVRNFYRQTTAHYPRVADQLEIRWLFDACREALGEADGGRFLAQLEPELQGAAAPEDCRELAASLKDYREGHWKCPYLPLALLCAVERYAEWERANVNATPEAREEEVEQVYRLYRLDRFPPVVRYQLYHRTFFKRADAGVAEAFTRLLLRLFRDPGISAVHLEELTGLQAALCDPAGREVFSRMVFPRARSGQRLEVLAVGASERKQVIVRSDILDRHGIRHVVREPVSPQEIGWLYRLLRDADYPKQISEQDHYLVITDESEQVLGGLTYVLQDQEVAYLNGIVVSATLKRRGLATALLEDFCMRLEAHGVRLVKTDFFLHHFFAANGFRVDERWGGLVRYLRT